jgi:two-component system OmpR family response regulator
MQYSAMQYSMNAKSPIRILVVDDEPDIRSILRSGLENEGYEVSEAGNKAELLHCLQTVPIDLITLDLDLGGENGLELAREARAKRNIPIVMITGKAEVFDRVVGLEQGADDYIVKPFHIREVLLRARSVLRRYELESAAEDVNKSVSVLAERYEFDGCLLDVPRRELKSANGEIVDLTDAEFDLLSSFLRRPNRILSRDELMQALNGRNWSPEDRTIDGHVARLRRKIDCRSEIPRLIKSVRGVGYVFTGDVEPLGHSETPSS